MATDAEMRKIQKQFLYNILKVKKENKSIDELVRMMKAEMYQEDFAFIEKVVNEE